MTAATSTAKVAGTITVGGSGRPVGVRLSVSPDTIVAELDCGDRLTVGHRHFVDAAIWMRGVVDGTWETADGAVLKPIAVAADDDRTRIAAGDFSRSLVLDTEVLHELLAAAQHRHSTMDMTWPFGPESDQEPIEIDVGVADLIAQLWGLGLPTSGACENQAGLAYVSFEDASAAEVFLRTVALANRPDAPGDVDPESLYARITDFDIEEPDDWQAYRKRRRWRLKAMLNEWGSLSDSPNRFAPAPTYLVSVTVLFPAADVVAATAALRDANLQAGHEVAATYYASATGDA